MASLLATVRDLDRLRQITIVLGKHGFGEFIARTGLVSLLGSAKAASIPPLSVGVRIRLVLEELGPSFVKLGQIVSTRPDLIPAEVVRELKKLQDEVPPVSFEELKPHLEKELGAGISEVYETFNERPLASASIAQVHRATLRNGDVVEEVVVKVQRPGIQRIIETDLDLLYWLARVVERSIPESKSYAPVKLVEEFDRAIKAELDFKLEADNAERFAENFRSDPNIVFPKIYRSASSRRALTLEFFDGKKVHDAVRDGASGETIARASVGIFMKQIFEDGFFHADPHPGNVFILGTPENPILGFIDLGLVGRLTPKLRDLTVDLMVAAFRKDHRGMADALYTIGRPTKKVDRDAFEAEVAVLSDKYLGKKLADMELSGMIGDLVYGATKYGLEIPPDFLLVGKCLVTVEGIGKEIYPELDVFQEIQPFFLRVMKERYSPERMTQDALRQMLRLSSVANDMPLQVQEILDDLRKGSLRLQINEPSLAIAAERVGRRIFSGLIVAACLLSGAILISSDHAALGIGAAVLGVVWATAHTSLVYWIGRSSRALRER
jgi:ubiquinone biosynthesis protein